MFKIIIPILVIALAAFVGMNAKSGLIRGVADGMLVSPARPAVAVKPAADFASVDARRVDLSPSVQNSMLQATSVQAVYALYNHEGPQAAPAHFVALLAVSQNDETWPVEPELGFPAIRHKKQDIDGFSGFADTYVLDAKDDPWASDEPALWENGSLEMCIRDRERLAPVCPRRFPLTLLGRGWQYRTGGALCGVWKQAAGLTARRRDPFRHF